MPVFFTVAEAPDEGAVLDAVRESAAIRYDQRRPVSGWPRHGKAAADWRQPARTPRNFYGNASTSRAASPRNDFESLRLTADALSHEGLSLRR